jgi:hypothetical protein
MVPALIGWPGRVGGLPRFSPPPEGCRIVRHEEGRECRKTLKVDFHLWPSRLASPDDTISAGSISAGSSPSRHPGGLATRLAGAADPTRANTNSGSSVRFIRCRPPVTPVSGSIFPGSCGSPTGAVPPRFRGGSGRTALDARGGAAEPGRGRLNGMGDYAVGTCKPPIEMSLPSRIEMSPGPSVVEVMRRTRSRPARRAR